MGPRRRLLPVYSAAQQPAAAQTRAPPPWRFQCASLQRRGRSRAADGAAPLRGMRGTHVHASAWAPWSPRRGAAAPRAAFWATPLDRDFESGVITSTSAGETYVCHAPRCARGESGEPHRPAPPARCGAPRRPRRVSPATVPHTCTRNSFPLYRADCFSKLPTPLADRRFAVESPSSRDRVARRLLPAGLRPASRRLSRVLSAPERTVMPMSK